MRYLKVTIHIESTEVELLSDYLFDLGCDGIEVKDSQTLLEDHPDHFGELYRLNANDYPKEGALIDAYFDDTYDLAQLKDDIVHITTNNGIYMFRDVTIDIVDLDEEDESWKAYHEEIVINDHLSIIPSWYESNDDGKLTIKIDPGLGFGTGSHPTTKMCLNHLDHMIQKDECILDFGTGSGILAILAAKLTNNTVYGVDLDTEALKNASYNANLNDVNVNFLNDITDVSTVVDGIVVNIVFDIIKSEIEVINRLLKQDGWLIVSGIVEEEAQSCRELLTKHKYEIINQTNEGDFIAFVCRKGA